MTVHDVKKTETLFQSVRHCIKCQTWGSLRGRLKAANIYASTNGLEISGPGQRHFLNWHVI